MAAPAALSKGGWIACANESGARHGKKTRAERSDLRHPEPCVVGDDVQGQKHRSDLENLVDRLGVSERVEFAGQQSDERAFRKHLGELMVDEKKRVQMSINARESVARLSVDRVASRVLDFMQGVELA